MKLVGERETQNMNKRKDMCGSQSEIKEVNTLTLYYLAISIATVQFASYVVIKSNEVSNKSRCIKCNAMTPLRKAYAY